MDDDLGPFAQFVPQTDTAVAEPEDLGEFAQFVPPAPNPVSSAVEAGKPLPIANESDLGPFTDFVPKSPAPVTQAAVQQPMEIAQAEAQQAIEANPRPALENIGKSIEAVRNFINEAAPGFLAQVTTSPLPATQFKPDATDSTATRIVKGTANAATGLVEGLTSPAMLAVGGAGGIVPQLAKPITAAFLADTAAHIPAAVAAVREAEKTPAGSQERVEAGLNMAGLLGITHALSSHLTKAGPAAAEVSSSGTAPDALNHSVETTPELRRDMDTGTGEIVSSIPPQETPVADQRPSEQPSEAAIQEQGQVSVAERLVGEEERAPDPTQKSDLPLETSQTDPPFDPSLPRRTSVQRTETQGPTPAILLDDGTVVVGKGAGIHAQVMDWAGVDASRVADGGWWGNISKTFRSGGQLSAERQGTTEIPTPQRVVTIDEQGNRTEQSLIAPESGLPKDFVSVGASTGADIPEGRVTSTKNEVVDAERKARGLQPILAEARQTNEATFEQAEAKLAENPDLGRTVVKGLLDGTKREVSEVDEAVLLHEKVTAQNEREAAGIRALDESLPPEERAQWQERYAEMEAHLNNIDQATHRAGSVWGRLGQFRQRLMRDDFTFESMERRARIAKGDGLTPEESATIKAQSEKIAELSKQLEDLLAGKEGEAATGAVDEAIRKVRVEADNANKRTRKQGVAPDLDGQRESILQGMRDRVADGDKPRDMRRWIQKLAENIVRSEPTLERDPFLDRLHAEVQKAVPELSRRQTMDLLSGYGDVKLLNPDATKARLRDLKGQLQQVAKIEDMMNRQAPRKTGIERRTPSDEERRLIKQVEELKKKGGFVVTDPAKQLKSALDAIKTRLRNQIADLDHQVATRTKIVKTKTSVPYDPEATALRQQRDTLKTQYDEIFGKPEMTDEQRLKIATAAVERGIADYERRIKESDFAPRSAKSVPVTAELETLRNQRNALRDEYKTLEAAAHPERALETALRVYKASLRRQTEQLQDRMARNDYAPRAPKVKPALDAEAPALKFDHAKAKEQYTKQLFEWQLANRTLPRKMLDNTREALNTTRALLTSLDLSAVLRQGGFITLGHPVRALRSFPAMFKALGSERGQFAVEHEIRSRPNAELYQQSKLYLADENATSLSKMEEAYMSRWANKIPLVGASQRAYVTFLNKLRADSFDAMHKTLSRDGHTLTPEEGKAIANYINVATGRGEMSGKFANAAVGMNTVFFAPRYVLSRFQMLALQPLYRGSAATRRLIATEYARYLVGVGVVYGLGQGAGGSVETDPRSSDFGKIRFGETRIDPLSGIGQASVLLTRIGTGESKGADSGEIKGLRENLRPMNLFRDTPDNEGPGPTDSSTPEVVGRFLRGKLSPQIGMSLDILTGKNLVGEPVSVGSTAVRSVTPLAFSDIYQTMQEQGVPAGTALGLVSLLGMGLQTYAPKEGRTSTAQAELPPVGLPAF